MFAFEPRPERKFAAKKAAALAKPAASVKPAAAAKAKPAAVSPAVDAASAVDATAAKKTPARKVTAVRKTAAKNRGQEDRLSVDTTMPQARGAASRAATAAGVGHTCTGCQESIVNRPVVFRRAVLTAALVAFVASAQAQTAKPPPRLPPKASQTSQIPGGVDTGTPGGSDSQQLGTPVMSNSTGQPPALRGGSAAARAAARPKPTASSADCTKAARARTTPTRRRRRCPSRDCRQDVATAAGQAAGRAGATRLDC